MKKFYLFLGLLIAILIGLMTNEPDKYQNITKLSHEYLYLNTQKAIQF